AVGVLGLAGAVAGLPVERRLLVAQVTGDGDAPADGAFGQRRTVGLGVTRGTDLRQHLPRDAHDLEHLIVPVERVQVHQHGAAGVADVGDVRATLRAAGQPPDDPGVDVAEDRVAPLGLLTHTIDVVQDPLHLRAGEVGRKRQTDLLLEAVLPAILAQFIDDLVRAGVLPDNRVV